LGDAFSVALIELILQWRISSSFLYLIVLVVFLPGFYCRRIHLHRHSRSVTRNASNWILCQDNISSVGGFRVRYGCCPSHLLDRVAGFARQRICVPSL
jgi:hypothetical protein